MTHERALQIRRLAAEIGPADWVLETDAPDIPPSWRCWPLAQRQAWAQQVGASGHAGIAPWRHEPADLPRIGACMAELRGVSVTEVQVQQWDNALAALPRLSYGGTRPAFEMPG